MSASDKMQSSMNHVHHLNSTTFKPFIESMGIVLLSAVILPFSSRSRVFVPEYQKIAHVMQNSGIKFAQINAIDIGDVLAPFPISTWPHIMLFQGFNNFRTYHGAFKEADIVSYLNRFLQFPVLSTISAISLPEFKRNSDVVVVGYIAAEDRDSKRQFELLAKKMHPEYLFGITNDPTLAESESINMPGVAVYKISNEKKNTLTLVDDVDKMVTNLRKTARPLIIDLTVELHEGFLDMGISFGYVFANTPVERARLRKEIEPLAWEYRKDIQFGIADPVDLEDIVDDLHLNISHLPAFAIREPITNLRYPMNETRGSFNDALKSFVRDYLGGKLQPTIKSEPVPKKSEEALTKVVGLNFHQIVMDKTKDVLLVFCIKPCGPCEALQPTIVTLAELHASNSKLKEKVTIAKVMYDANDTPIRGIRGFPTIELFPAASKSASVRLLGPRTLDDLADFIRDNGTHKADLRDPEDKQILGQETSAALLKQEACVYENGECVATASLGTESGHPENSHPENDKNAIAEGIESKRQGEL